MDGQDRMRDFLSGALFVAIGVVAVLVARHYPLGTARQLGPGALPTMLGLLLIAVGAGLALQTWIRRDKAGPLLAAPGAPSGRAVRAVVFVSLSLVTFAVLIRPAGLFIATAALAFIGRHAEPGGSALGSVALALTLATVCVLIFVTGIGLPFRVWP